MIFHSNVKLPDGIQGVDPAGRTWPCPDPAFVDVGGRVKLQGLERGWTWSWGQPNNHSMAAEKNMLYIFKKVMHHWASNLWLNQSNPATTPSLRDFGHPWSIFWSSVRTCLCSYVILYDSHRWLWPSSEKPSSGITVGFAVTRWGFWWLMNYAIQ